MKQMRRILISLAIVIIAILTLNQCTARDLTFRGEVVAIQNEAGYPTFLIRTTDEKELYILTDKTTFLHSWLEETEPDALVSGELNQPVVQVFITTRPRRMKVEDKTYRAYLADQIILLSAVEFDAYTLPDGTKLDVRRHDDRRIYQTKDGTAILSEQLPVGPDRVSVGGQLSLEALEPRAQQRILHWYENRGLLYNLDAEIQKAWKAYNACENKVEFQNYHVYQEVYPNAYNDRLIWFATGAAIPVDSQVLTDTRSCAAFRRDTGEHVPLEYLFTCSPEDIGDLVLDAADTAPEQLADLKQAFRPEYLVFHSDALELWFPAGSLPDTEYASIVSVEYKNLTDILHPWTIPDSAEE